MASSPRVFISYARKDGDKYAKELLSRIEAENIPCWLDRVALRGGQDWWLQIKDALDQAEYFVLVMTPGAIESKYTRKEWNYARQQGVCVFPVMATPDLDFDRLPRWMRDAHFYNLKHEWPKFISDLNTRCQEPRVPFMVEDLPEHFVQRPDEFDLLVESLLDENREEPKAITTALQGAGGFGKTTLAIALCHQDIIQQAFHDGILWVTLGENPGNLVGKVSDLIIHLTGDSPGYTDIEAATSHLAEILADRDILMVIDDLWNAADLRPFMRGGDRCTSLITTRNKSTLPDSAICIDVDAMQEREAIELLGMGLCDDDKDELKGIVNRLGEWPLLLQLVNRRLFDDVVRNGMPLTEALDSVNQELDEFGLTSFDTRNAKERNQAVAASYAVSLKRLQSDAQYGRVQIDEVACFRALAIFPEDATIPVDTIASLWGQTGNLSARATKRLCRRLADLSLVLRFDRQAQTVRLHDVTRHYLIDQTSHQQYLAWQNALLESYSKKCGGEWWQLPDDGYIYQNLLWHLQEANQQDRLEQLLFTYRWLDAKLQATDIVSLIHDFDLRRDTDRHSKLGLLQHALQMSVSVLARDKDQLVSQLYSRLSGMGPDLEAIVDEMARQEWVSWLQSRMPMLTPPGGNLVFTLGGHTAGVTNLVLTPDGRLITSCSSGPMYGRDHTVKVWDLERGTLIHSLEGHTSGVSNLQLTPDGRLITSCSSTGGSDPTVKVWDLEGGTLLHSLEGHKAGVSNLLLTSDRQLITSCWYKKDPTVKVWDIEHGTLTHSLEGHTAGVSKLMLTPGGHLITSCSSNSSDHTVKIWDFKPGTFLRSLEGHTAGVSNLLLTPDGRLITSCSSNIYGRDYTVKVWDIERGTLIHSLEGHKDGDPNLLLTPDGRLITSCRSRSDHTVKVWDIEHGSLTHSLEGHTAGVYKLLLTPDGRLITSCSSSYSSDHTVKVWDIEDGALIHSLEGHMDWVSKLLLTPDGRLITSSSDHTVKVWDIEDGALIHSLEGHTDGVYNILLTDDVRLITSSRSSSDHTIKVWDLGDGMLTHSPVGHIAGVSNLQLALDGRLITSCSRNDHTVKVWDIEHGSLTHSLEGHTAGVSNLLLTPDGRLITSCGSINRNDTTVKVWDLGDGTLIHSLEGHTTGVSKLSLMPDGRLITSCGIGSTGLYGGDPTVKVWDIQHGALIHSLKGHTTGVDNLLLTPDGRLITSCSGNDRTVNIWDIEHGALIHSLKGHLGGVTNLLLTPDGRLITSYSGRSDQTVKIWDIQQGALLHSLEGHTDGVFIMLLTPNGYLITSCYGSDHTVKIWDIEDGALIHSLEGHTDGVTNLLLTANGRLITSCSSSIGKIGISDPTVKIWDIEGGTLVHSLEGHTAGVSNLMLMPDERLITSCGSSGDSSIMVWDIERNTLITSGGGKIGISDPTVKVWDIEGGTLIHSLEGHIATIRRVILEPASGHLITAGGQRLNIWSLESGETIAQFTTDGPILSCKLARNGTIVAGDELGRVHFLRLVEPG